MRELTLLFLVAATAVVSPLKAAETIAQQEVRDIATGWGAEGIYVSTTAKIISAEGCGPGFRIEANHPMVKTMTALLMTAFSTGAKVNLYVDGCAGPETMNLKAVNLTR